MKVLPLIAAVLGVLVLLSEIQWIGRTTLWIPFIALAVGLILVAVEQIRHGGQ